VLPRLRKPRAKNAQASFTGLIAAGMLLVAIGPLAPLQARAFPIQTPFPTASPTASMAPTPAPPRNVLPFGSTVSFVLDGTISSASSKAGQVVDAHLAQPLVVDGITVAPQSATTQIKIVDASPASNPDVYGYVDIFVRPLRLPDGRTIPLRAPATHLNVNVSAGHASTADIENTIGDIFTPTLLLHVFRKGRNFVLEPGATIKLRTQATLIALPNRSVAIETPAPLVPETETPVSSYRAMPMVTPEATGRMPFPVPTLTPGPIPTM
jgi:hypothetical protein